MDTQIYYHGSDGHIKQLGDQELQHWKYIKKIGNHYFYSMEALQAYYKHQQRMANAEYTKDRMGDKANQLQRGAQITRDYATGRDTQEQYQRNKKINKAVYDAQGVYRKTKKTVKPVAKTAKRAVTPVDPKKAAKKKVEQILNQPPKKKKRPVKQHNYVKPSRYKPGTAASRW